MNATAGETITIKAADNCAFTIMLGETSLSDLRDFHNDHPQDSYAILAEQGLTHPGELDGDYAALTETLELIDRYSAGAVVAWIGEFSSLPRWFEFIESYRGEWPDARAYALDAFNQVYAIPDELRPFMSEELIEGEVMADMCFVSGHVFALNY